MTLFFSFALKAEISNYNQLKYKTYFGNCPTRSAGEFSLKLIKKYEKLKSLFELKNYIRTSKLDQKYFIDEYKINYSPNSHMLRFSLNCPVIKAKVSLQEAYPKSNSKIKKQEVSDQIALLSQKGKLIDPGYEVLLRAEKLLDSDLPLVVFPMDRKKLDNKENIAFLLSHMEETLYNSISEMIIEPNYEMTLILSVHNRPITVFLGQENWQNKMNSLSKMIRYFDNKKRYPHVVNLTNIKKVVVKF